MQWALYFGLCPARRMYSQNVFKRFFLQMISDETCKKSRMIYNLIGFNNPTKKKTFTCKQQFFASDNLTFVMRKKNQINKIST